jgi:hypothetical protein
LRAAIAVPQFEFNFNRGLIPATTLYYSAAHRAPRIVQPASRTDAVLWWHRAGAWRRRDVDTPGRV